MHACRILLISCFVCIWRILSQVSILARTYMFFLFVWPFQVLMSYEKCRTDLFDLKVLHLALIKRKHSPASGWITSLILCFTWSYRSCYSYCTAKTKNINFHLFSYFSFVLYFLFYIFLYIFFHESKPAGRTPVCDRIKMEVHSFSLLIWV